MARELGYTPPTPSDSTADTEVADLVAALHESGLLRALTGATRAYPQLLRSLLGTTDAGTIRSLIALSRGFKDLDPDESERLAFGIRRARAAAVEAASGRPEGARLLWRRLRDPNTRRGMSAALAALAALGDALPPADEGRFTR